VAVVLEPRCQVGVGYTPTILKIALYRTILNLLLGSTSETMKPFSIHLTVNLKQNGKTVSENIEP